MLVAIYFIMPPKKSKIKSSTEPKNTRSSHGEAAAAAVAGLEQPKAPIGAVVVEPPCEKETQGLLTSGQNGIPPSQSGNDSEGGYDWEACGGIDVPDVPVNPFFAVQKEPVSNASFRQPNFTGHPVSASQTSPVYITMELLQRIQSILDSSKILSQIGEDSSKSATKHGSIGDDKRFDLSGHFQSAMVCLLKSIGVPDVSHVLSETNISKTAQFLKSASQSSNDSASQGLKIFLSLFSNETLSLRELLSGCSCKTSRLESSSIKLNVLTDTLMKVQQSERLKVLFEIFCSWIQSRRARDSTFTIERIMFLPFLEHINQDCFPKSTEASLNRLVIDLIKRARIVLEKIQELEKEYNASVETIHSLSFHIFLTESISAFNSELKTARSESSNASSQLKDLRNDFSTVMLVVCSIFRFLNKNSLPKVLFWEIMKFVQDTKTMEHIPALCFDTQKECDSAMNVVLSKDAIPSHRSNTSVNSANTGLMSLEECLNSIKGANKTILNISKTGKGKTTCYAMAHVLEAVSKSLQGNPTTFVLIGPMNHASDTLIHCICHVIQEQMSHGMTKSVRIVPVIGMISPKIISSADQIIVYVFVIDSMNSFPAVTSFFGSQDHQIIVMVDDNEEFGTDLNEGLKMVRKDKRVKSVTMCSASYDPSLFDSLQNVIVFGSGTSSLSDLSSLGMIIHEVPLSVGQMNQIWELIHFNLDFFHLNNEFFLEIKRVLMIVSKARLDNKQNLSDSLAALLSLYDYLLKSPLVNTIDHRVRKKNAAETDADFFVGLLSVVLKLLVRMFKSKGVSFQKDVIMTLFQHLVDLDDPEGGCKITPIYIATLLEKFLIDYTNFHQKKIILPEPPKSIIDVSSLQKLDEEFKKMIELLSSSGFCFPDDLLFPKPVPHPTDCEYRDAFGDIKKKAHHLVILGPTSNAFKVASDMADECLNFFKRVEGIPEKEFNDSDGRQSNANGGNTNSSGGSSSSGSENFSFNMNDTYGDKLKKLMEYSKKIKKQLSQNAPVPTESEISDLGKLLIDTNNPLTFLILKNFVLGIFVPTYDNMSEQMTKLIVKIFEDRRLCMVIQEGLWNLKSQNFILLYQTYIICFSEVSFEFFMQNILGRFGRVSQANSALVMCFTPSGKIVDSRLSGGDFKCQAQMVSSEQLGSELRFLSPFFLHRVCDFLNGCFTLDSKEVQFVIELLRMSDAAIYDERFKYACHGDDYHNLFQLMSCYLVSQYCTLGATGNVEIKPYMKDFLKSIAINYESRIFKYLKEDGKDSIVRDLFFTATCQVMPHLPHLSTAFLLSNALDCTKCPDLDQRLLVKIYFEIRNLMRFVEVVLAFLKNLWVSKTIQEQNPEIRAVIAVVDEVKKTVDRLICLIASRVDQSHFMKALDAAAMCDESPSVVNPVVALNPLETLRHDLQGCSQTIQSYYLILQDFSKQFPDNAAIFNIFKKACMIFGKDCVVRCELLELKKDPKMSQAGLDECDLQITAIQVSMNTLTGPPALRTKKKLELNEKLEKQKAIRLDIERKISLMAEHEASLTKYEGMSEEQFLAHFLSENFD